MQPSPELETIVRRYVAARRMGDFDRVRNLREVLSATGAGIYLATHQAGPLPARGGCGSSSNRRDIRRCSSSPS